MDDLLLRDDVTCLTSGGAVALMGSWEGVKKNRRPEKVYLESSGERTE